MDSFDKIDYRLRPAKHAERVMLVDLFRRLPFCPSEEYQYVGFGSVAFIDFKMVHRFLGIENLISIEGTDDDNNKIRFENNKPYSGIDLRFGHSSSILPTIDFSSKSLVWLDYDGALSRSMSNDIGIVARKAPSGTFIGVTFTTAFPATDNALRLQELARLKQQFPEYIPDDVKPQQFDGGQYAEFGRQALGGLLEQAVSEADAGLSDLGEKRSVFQVCNFRYKDGAPMVTFGWVIVSDNDFDLFADAQLTSLPFVRTDQAHFRITIPFVTPLEIGEMERRLPALQNAADLDWIPAEHRKAFSKIYRYLPHFGIMEHI